MLADHCWPHSGSRTPPNVVALGLSNHSDQVAYIESSEPVEMDVEKKVRPGPPRLRITYTYRGDTLFISGNYTPLITVVVRCLVRFYTTFLLLNAYEVEKTGTKWGLKSEELPSDGDTGKCRSKKPISNES